MSAWKKKYEEAVDFGRPNSSEANSNKPSSPISKSSPISPSKRRLLSPRSRLSVMTSMRPVEKDDDERGASPMSDMDQILSPTMETFDNGEPYHSEHDFGSFDRTLSGISSQYSADSIIRRVEEEIAQARRNQLARQHWNKLSGARSPINNNKRDVVSPSSQKRIDSFQSDEDMHDILNTVTEDEKKSADLVDEREATRTKDEKSSDDDEGDQNSFTHALDLIDEEFENVEEETVFTTERSTYSIRSLHSGMHPRGITELNVELSSTGADMLDPHLQATPIRAGSKELMDKPVFTDEEWQELEDDRSRAQPNDTHENKMVPSSTKQSISKDSGDKSTPPPSLKISQQSSEENQYIDDGDSLVQELGRYVPTPKAVSPHSFQHSEAMAIQQTDGKGDLIAKSPVSATISVSNDALDEDAISEIDSTEEDHEKTSAEPQKDVGINLESASVPSSSVTEGIEVALEAKEDFKKCDEPSEGRSHNNATVQRMTGCETDVILDSMKEKRANSSQSLRSDGDSKTEERSSSQSVQSQETPKAVTAVNKRNINVHNNYSRRSPEPQELQKVDDAPSPRSQGKPTDSGEEVIGQPRLLTSEEKHARRSRRIRFRDPFPTLKPPPTSEAAEVIMKNNAVEVPDYPMRWVKPKAELKQLIVAAMGPSLPRRSNACGALKVLTTQKKNQMTLVRTDSFLAALLYAASQDIPPKERDLALDARTRAVACLRNVCTPKDNRIPVLKHPGLVECLRKVIEQDFGEGRVLACGTLALLAKSPECREILGQSEGLIELLAHVLSGKDTPPPVAPTFTTSPTSEASVQHRRNDRRNDRSVSPSSRTSAGSSSGVEDSDSETDHDSVDSETSSSSSSSSEDAPSPLGPQEDEGDIERIDSIRQRNVEMRDRFYVRSRSNACAVLLHLSKQCSVAHLICQDESAIRSIMNTSKEFENPIHSKCLEILCNLTRFPYNNAVLTRFEGLVYTFVLAANSAVAEDRIAALRSIQNMSADASSKAILASAPVLNLMTTSAMRKIAEEKEAAVATLYNLTTEPGAVVSITNTKNVVATLVHLAHNPDSSSTIRMLACEALATISLWLQTLAGTGSVPEDLPLIPLPSQKTSGWERWD